MKKEQVEYTPFEEFANGFNEPGVKSKLWYKVADMLIQQCGMSYMAILDSEFQLDEIVDKLQEIIDDGKEID